jgi:hypothetical protein
LRDLYPDVAAELVRCLSNGDFTAASLRPSSNRKCLWRCSQCDHEWSAPPAARIRGRGCPECGREQTRRARTMATADQSLAHLHPSLAKEFVACPEEPVRSPSDLAPGSNKKCVWQCATCLHQWTTTVASRVAGTGCPACGRLRTAAARARPASGSALSDIAPMIACELKANLTHPGRDAPDLKPASHDRCRWRCTVCAHEWETTVKNRTRGGTGCPMCRKRGAGR